MVVKSLGQNKLHTLVILLQMKSTIGMITMLIQSSHHQIKNFCMGQNFKQPDVELEMAVLSHLKDACKNAGFRN